MKGGVTMDFFTKSGYFARRIVVPEGLPATIFSFPFKALLGDKLKVEKVIEYEQIGARSFERELLEYPDDPTLPAYAVKQ